MRASTLLTLATASLAAAAPAKQQQSTNEKFSVSNFVFGCTVGCNYYFDVSYKDGSAHCEGTLDDKDYVKCKATGKKNKAETLYAYIDTASDKNELKLQAQITDAKAGSYCNYYGQKQVYAATSADADKQKENFKVKNSSATCVA